MAIAWVGVIANALAVCLDFCVINTCLSAYAQLRDTFLGKESAMSSATGYSSGKETAGDSLFGPWNWEIKVNSDSKIGFEQPLPFYAVLRRRRVGKCTCHFPSTMFLCHRA